MSVLAIFLAVFLFASPAYAVLTDAENASLHRFRGGWTSVSRAMFALSTALKNGRTDVGQVALALTRTHSRASQTWGLVFVGIEASNNPNEREVLRQMTRTELVAVGWDRLDRALWRLGQARDSAKALELDGVVVQIDRAFEKFNSTDRTLSYSNPFPDSYPQIIGPHGDYDAALRGLWLSVWYMTGVQSTVADIYRGKPVSPEGIKALQAALIQGRDMTGAVVSSMCNLVNCYQNEFNKQFFVIIGALKPLTIKVPLKFSGILRAFTKWNPSHGRFHPFVLQKLIDAWRTADAAIWNAMKFGDCTKTGQPKLCAGFGG